jgi:5'-nucleotidase
MKKLVLFGMPLLSCAFLISGCGDNNDQDTVSSPIEMRILHTNDHHSYLEGQTYTLNLDYDTTVAGSEAVRLNLGGFSRIASAINQYRTANTLVLNSGELNGTLYFSLFKGEADFKVFNYLGLDAYELGNHEFDEGDAHLATLIDQATFPIIAGNVHPNANSPLYGSKICHMSSKKLMVKKLL